MLEARFAQGGAPGGAPGPALEAAPPRVTRALHQLVPFLSLADRLLAALVWATPAATRNMALVLLGAILILHWGHYALVVLPTLVALAVGGSVWALQRSLEPRALTLTQLSHALGNFNVMCEYLFPQGGPGSTARRVADWRGALRWSLLLTPLHVYVVRGMGRQTGVRVWLLSIFLGGVLWHSGVGVASRALLWRWKVVRRLVCMLGPLAPTPGGPPDPADSLSARDNLDVASVASVASVATDIGPQLRQSIHYQRQEAHEPPEGRLDTDAFDGAVLTAWPGLILTPISRHSTHLTLTILENERYIPGLGWGKRLLINRQAYASPDIALQWNTLQDLETALAAHCIVHWVHPWQQGEWTRGDSAWVELSHDSPYHPLTRWRPLIRRGIVAKNRNCFSADHPC